MHLSPNKQVHRIPNLPGQCGSDGVVFLLCLLFFLFGFLLCCEGFECDVSALWLIGFTYFFSYDFVVLDFLIFVINGTLRF